MRKIHLSAVAVSGVAMAVAALATPAFAQSTGTLEFENQIVVNAKRSDTTISGMGSPDTSKAKGQLTQDWIQHQMPGQSVNDMINYLPGVSFQNNDPYGSAGGTLTIRGFDASRISETFDGVTLNDDGNYALYANELLDSEVIDQVTVNLGTTDVDSPTASASGSTVNYTSHNPTDQFHVRMAGGAGTDDFYRMFGMIDTGVFTPWGTKAWFSASKTGNNSPYNNVGKMKKESYNGKIYQPLGSNGDFISIAGFYTTLRNGYGGKAPMSNVALNSTQNIGLTYFPGSYGAAYTRYTPCTTAGSSNCGASLDYGYNPTNIGNLRAAMKVTLTDHLVWTFDPSYQFTKANGGSSTALVSEGTSTGGYTGYVNGTYYAGKDLNGDGDTKDSVRYMSPSETKTHRIALTTSLRYDVMPHQTLRLAYAFSRSLISQTGELAPLTAYGFPSTYFPINDNTLTDASGNVIEKRNTYSISMLNQISGEYRGQFFDSKLTVTAGVRAPFIHRDLTNNCFTYKASGAVTCVPASQEAAYAASYPYVVNGSSVSGSAVPQRRTYDYSGVLPNVGFTYKLPMNSEVFANYSKGMSAPQTTALYQSFYFPKGYPGAEPGTEKTDNFDLGYRYGDRRLSAQLDLWYTHFTNRLGSSYNPAEQTSVYSNLGTVNRYGFDGNVAYRITPKVTAYVFGSWLHSRIQSNVATGACSSITTAQIASGGYACVGSTAYLLTAGKTESGMPTYTVGGRLQGTSGPITLGIQAKVTGQRYVNDENVGYFITNSSSPTGVQQVFEQRTPSYAVVDLDARFALSAIGLNDRSFFQLNVTNLFNKYYVGAFSGTTTVFQSYTVGSGASSSAQISPPRAIVGTLTFGY